MTIFAVYVSRNFRTGGQKRYLELLSGLASRNHTIHLFLRQELIFPIKLPHSIILHHLSIQESRSQQRSFTKALKNFNREDLADLNGQAILLFGDSSLLCGIFLKKILKIPLIIAIRNNIVIADRIARRNSIKNIPNDMRNLYRERQLSRYADKLIFQTAHDRDSICNRNGYSIEKTAVIPNSIRAGWFKPDFRNSNKSEMLKNIIFIGSDHKRKGLNALLSALVLLREKGRDFTLSLVGDFPLTSGDELPEWVHLTGRLDTPLPGLAKADLLIVPSLYDSFPNTVLESLFVGTPVIGTDVAGIKAMLEHKSLLFPANSAAGIVEKLEPLFDRNYYGQVKQLCRERLTHFDFDWIDPWEKILKSHIIEGENNGY